MTGHGLALLLGKHPEWDIEPPPSAPRRPLEWYLQRARRREAERASKGDNPSPTEDC